MQTAARRPPHPPTHPTTTPEAPGAASPIHGRIAVNCRMGMCYISWVLLVWGKKVTSRLVMSRNVTDVQKCGEWPPFFWLSELLFLLIPHSIRVAVHATIRGHTSMWVNPALKSPAGIIWFAIPPSPDTNDRDQSSDTLANRAYSTVI